MLSILIPVYNFDVRKLVADLHHQCLESGIVFEIILYDDLSDAHYRELNQSTEKLRHVQYNKLGKNLGRSRIRNVLGGAASYPFLLFMDCDSKVVKPDYISTYVKHLAEKTVLYGGRCYTPEPPEEQEYFFHWQYGKKREEQTAARRTRQPYHAFMTNNFLMPKKVFLETMFDERIRHYGHEDTLFGMALQEKQVPIVHLDNPLEHIGLEKGIVFLDKNKSSLRNLLLLRQSGILLDTRLLRFLQKIKKLRLAGFVQFLAQQREPVFIKNLNEAKTGLWEFDLWKLGNLIALEREFGL